MIFLFSNFPFKGGSINEQGNWTYVDDVYKFNKETTGWDKVGQLQQARAGHGMSVVDLNKVQQFCQPETGILV